jgi:hypothetical protein
LIDNDDVESIRIGIEMVESFEATADASDLVTRAVKDKSKCGRDRRFVVHGQNFKWAIHRVRFKKAAVFGPILAKDEGRRSAALARAPTLRLGGDMLGREAEPRDRESRQSITGEHFCRTSGSVRMKVEG